MSRIAPRLLRGDAPNWLTVSGNRILSPVSAGRFAKTPHSVGLYGGGSGVFSLDISRQFYDELGKCTFHKNGPRTTHPSNIYRINPPSIRTHLTSIWTLRSGRSYIRNAPSPYFHCVRHIETSYSNNTRGKNPPSI